MLLTLTFKRVLRTFTFASTLSHQGTSIFCRVETKGQYTNSINRPKSIGISIRDSCFKQQTKALCDLRSKHKSTESAHVLYSSAIYLFALFEVQSCAASAIATRYRKGISIDQLFQLSHLHASKSSETARHSTPLREGEG